MRNFCIELFTYYSTKLCFYNFPGCNIFVEFAPFLLRQNHAIVRSCWKDNIFTATKRIEKKTFKKKLYSKVRNNKTVVSVRCNQFKNSKYIFKYRLRIVFFSYFIITYKSRMNLSSKTKFENNLSPFQETYLLRQFSFI